MEESGDLMLYSTVYPHAELGDLTIASDGEAIVGLWIEGQKYFAGKVAGNLQRRDDLPVFAQVRAWLDRYFDGDPLPVATLHLKPGGTPFQQRVWKLLADIPYGELRTYAELAAQIACDCGGKASARAVGTANGRNPISIILPCHRVIGSDGSLTGYAGGIARKVWLLEHEGADLTGLYVPKRGTAL
ncbi:methylated-DNA--[protein]-cysteine S-methyltransferase [Gordonibacter urolithinfaciens]|uniref:methylated-DNA--[protein]-cysteine S-methyltransferase n=2 Tax=Gordonibacter TaxID=644652 RepID=UPI0026045E4F|nr:methylated-DNA--[protein]-cysteine S-methyltransferase [Gordonibacter sp. RACS_AR49]MDN4508858.1 methylated-DNA--[protein]-cysteine S-methyltransferase [Gordonibacter sp. RACS_AR49]